MAGRIYITGDTHADFRRFNSANFPEQRELDKDDYVIICGDAGILWTDDREGRYWLNWLTDKPFTTLFIDGNHDNFDSLNARPVSEWHGGRVHMLSPSVIHLMRGQIFTIAGLRFFAFGGAQSHDIEDGILQMDDPHFHDKLRRLRRRGAHYRINRLNWWQEELPSAEECAAALRNLEACGYQADCILTHAAPATAARLLLRGAGTTAPEQFLEDIRQKCRYDKWFFGHYHEDRRLSLHETAVYQSILRLQ